jgi:hypothetical protein
MTTPLNRSLPNAGRPARPIFPMTAQNGGGLFLGWGPKV